MADHEHQLNTAGRVAAGTKGAFHLAAGLYTAAFFGSFVPVVGPLIASVVCRRAARRFQADDGRRAAPSVG